MAGIDVTTFLLALSGSFILTMSAGWALLKTPTLLKKRKTVKIVEPYNQNQDHSRSENALAAGPGETLRKKGTLRRALYELRPYTLSIIILLVISLAAIPITLVTPLPIKLIVDNVLGSSSLPGYLAILAPGSSQFSRDDVLWLAIGILLGSTLLNYLQNLLNVWFTNKIGNRMTLDVRDRLFRQMQRLSISYHDTKGSADSTYRTLQDAPALRSFGVDTIIPLITSVLTLGAMILVTLFLDWQ
ncbi:MAG TPA: ABC transporter transmembrane domain-containing protein, partial [Candidatus Bathyarchaeia archaeon]|nr:ABC transporter transmembrane domain-containing protein [Candidatus Bathyarchaeia archaeon]